MFLFECFFDIAALGLVFVAFKGGGNHGEEGFNQALHILREDDASACRHFHGPRLMWLIKIVHVAPIRRRRFRGCLLRHKLHHSRMLARPIRAKRKQVVTRVANPNGKTHRVYSPLLADDHLQVGQRGRRLEFKLLRITCAV